MDLSNEKDRAYTAGIFDAKGTVEVTRGSAILRVKIAWRLEYLPVCQRMYLRPLGGELLMTDRNAFEFLLYVQPFVKKKKDCVDQAIQVWSKRKALEADFHRKVNQSVRSMPNCS